MGFLAIITNNNITNIETTNTNTNDGNTSGTVVKQIDTPNNTNEPRFSNESGKTEILLISLSILHAQFA